MLIIPPALINVSLDQLAHLVVLHQKLALEHLKYGLSRKHRGLLVAGQYQHVLVVREGVVLANRENHVAEEVGVDDLEFLVE